MARAVAVQRGEIDLGAGEQGADVHALGGKHLRDPLDPDRRGHPLAHSSPWPCRTNELAASVTDRQRPKV